MSLAPLRYNFLVSLALVMVAFLTQGLEVIAVIEVFTHGPWNDMVNYICRLHDALLPARFTERMLCPEGPA